MDDKALRRFEELVLEYRAAAQRADIERGSVETGIFATLLTTLIGSVFLSALFKESLSDPAYWTIQGFGIAAFFTLFAKEQIMSYILRNSRTQKVSRQLWFEVRDFQDSLGPDLQYEADKIRERLGR